MFGQQQIKLPYHVIKDIGKNKTRAQKVESVNTNVKKKDYSNYIHKKGSIFI